MREISTQIVILELTKRFKKKCTATTLISVAFMRTNLGLAECWLLFGSLFCCSLSLQSTVSGFTAAEKKKTKMKVSFFFIILPKKNPKIENFFRWRSRRSGRSANENRREWPDCRTRTTSCWKNALKTAEVWCARRFHGRGWNNGKPKIIETFWLTLLFSLWCKMKRASELLGPTLYSFKTSRRYLILSNSRAETAIF